MDWSPGHFPFETYLECHWNFFWFCCSRQAGCHALASDWRVPLLGLAVAAFESSMSLAWTWCRVNHYCSYRSCSIGSFETILDSQGLGSPFSPVSWFRPLDLAKIGCTGVQSSLAMWWRYVFVFNWTPALDSCSSTTPPHGLIFSAFMKPWQQVRSCFASAKESTVVFRILQ